MRSFCSRALLLHRNSNLLPRPSRFFQVYRFSASPSGNSFYGNKRRQEEDTRNVRVSVWWDLESCEVPADVSEFKVAHAISTAIRTNGMKGPIQITAFGDVCKLARNRQHALSSSGINVVHIPNGGKSSADRSLLVDLLYWISQNPPPAHLFLISGDKDFAGILHRLRMSNYNILFASREDAPAALCFAASITWRWSSLVKGEDFNGKIYNQPPDGPYNSWYGHYKRPLEDPFAIQQKQQALSKAKGAECWTEPKMLSIKTVLEHVQQILRSRPNGKIYNQPPDGPYNSWYGHYKRPLEDPFAIQQKQQALSKAKGAECWTEPKMLSIKTVLEHVHQILRSRPKGISVQELEVELRKFHLCKDYYGYTTIAHFLEAIPHIAKLKLQSDGTCIVQPVTGPNLEREHDSGDNNDERSLEPLQELIAEENFKRVGVASADQNVERYPQHENQLKAENMNTEKSEAQKSKPEAGAVRSFWKRWFSYSDDVSNLECNGALKQIPASALVKCVGSEDKSDEGMGKERVSYHANASNLKELVSPSDGSANTEQASASSEKYNDKSGTDTSLFQRVVKWCKFWRVDDKLEVPSEGSDVSAKQEEISNSAINEVFSTDKFWSEMKSFLESPTASIVFQSTTRAAMSKNLQKVGPECLKTLSQSELLHLVHLLISEKKYVKEQPILPFPFARPASSAKSSLTSLFTNKQDVGGETKADGGYTPAAKKKKGPERPRGEIIADCKKLVSEVIKEYPNGYNVGLFRRAFLEKYGYPLDLDTLGYKKLTDLIQIFPEVNVDSGQIVPSFFPISKTLISCKTAAQKVLKEAESNVIADLLLKKQDDNSSAWEELGPASVAEEKKEGKLLGSGGYYEPVVIEDEFSESEDEGRLMEPEGRRLGKQSKEEDASSFENEGNTLLQILGSWDAREKGTGIGNRNRNLSDRMTRIPFRDRARHDKKVYSFVKAKDDNDHR